MAKRKRVKIRKGSRIGCYRLLDILGSGGNGDVWRVLDGNNNQFAMKILRQIDAVSFMRFKAEIHVLSTIKVDGIMSILDSNIPDDIESSVPWFTMEVAKSFSSYINGKKILDTVSDFIPLAKTLEHLHDRSITHRDIKPQNILFYNERLYFTDFGLVKYPSREDITPSKRDVGAKFTMAPEMRRSADTADSKKADVYSFAKTIWISITGEEHGFDGQYSTNSVLGLKNYHKGLYLTKLDELLSDATDNDPDVRPTIGELISCLEAWVNLNRDFQKRNVTEWFEIQQILFPMGSPETATWKSLDAIVSVLNEVSKERSLNHMFYPDGGGMTITSVSKAKEAGMLALHTSDKSADLLKPKKLTYESFGLDPSWNYFRLEADLISATSIYDGVSYEGLFQEFTEVNPAEYADLRCWDENEFNGVVLPESSRRISRYIKGSFVFFCTASVYNKLRGKYDAYNGQHDSMSESDFRNFIKTGAKECSEIDA